MYNVIENLPKDKTNYFRIFKQINETGLENKCQYKHFWNILETLNLELKLIQNINK